MRGVTVAEEVGLFFVSCVRADGKIVCKKKVNERRSGLRIEKGGWAAPCCRLLFAPLRRCLARCAFAEGCGRRSSRRIGSRLRLARLCRDERKGVKRR